MLQLKQTILSIVKRLHDKEEMGINEYGEPVSYRPMNIGFYRVHMNICNCSFYIYQR